LLGSAALNASVTRSAFAKWEKPDRRVALVVGFDDYKESELRFANPTCVSDATAVATKLKEFGFLHVALESDLSRKQFSDAVQRFVDNHKRSADLAVVFFAGHGVHDGSQSSLLPSDVRIGSPDELAACSIALEDLVGWR
jgi:uncharacterized caspase-like protein